MQKFVDDSDNENTPKTDPEIDSENEEDDVGAEARTGAGSGIVSGFKKLLQAKGNDDSDPDPDSDSATLTDIEEEDIEGPEDVEGEGEGEEAGNLKPSFVTGLSKLMKRVGSAIENVGSETGSAAAEQGDVAKPSTRKQRTSRKKSSRFVQPTQEELEQEDEGGEGEEGEGEFDEDEDYESSLKKFDKELRDDYLVNFHPESLIQNYDEIYNLARVVRNPNGVIVDTLHKTLPIMTKYEKTRILGQRAKQINDGATPFVKVQEGVIDGYLIALKELEEKKIPFIIRRPLPNRGSEYWYVEDLEIIN